MSAYAAPFIGARVINRACTITGCRAMDLVGPSRLKVVAEIRFACMAAMRRAGMSYPEIGRRLGGRDHATIIHGVRRAAALAASPDFATLIEDIAE